MYAIRSYYVSKNHITFDVFDQGDGKNIWMLMVIKDFRWHQSQSDICPHQSKYADLAMTRIKNRGIKAGLLAFVHNQS